MLSYIQSSDEYDIDQLKAAFEQVAYTQDQLDDAKQQIVDSLGDMEGTIVNQKAIVFAQDEYTSIGLSVDDMQMSYLYSTGLKMLGVTLLMVVVAILVGLIASRTAAGIGRDLRRQVFGKVVGFSNQEIDHFSTASLITRSTNDVQQIQMVATMLMRIVLYAPILGVGGVIMVASTNVSMSWVIGLAVVVMLGVMALLFSLTLPKFKIMQKLIDKLNLVSREILVNMPVIRAFGREKHEEERFERASRDLMKTQLFTNRTMTFMMPLMTVVMNGVSVLIVWTAAQQIDMGAMQVGDMIAFITYAMVIIMSFLMIAMVSIMLPRANVAAERIDEVISMKTTIEDPATPVDMAKVEQKAGSTAGTVVFDHVDFRFSGAEEDALSNISFTTPPGTTTAIIGSTGCGKSTLLNLIPRFYDVTGGSVSVDGVDIRDMTQHDLHSLIGYVPQKGVLFSGTIEDNIKFGGDAITDDAMREAAQVAQATEFIDSRDKGYAEPISQSGTNVSGGQKQRLSIARALATQAPILLFDDSFSALDYKTDTKLRQALHDRETKASVIIVAQRIATVLHADQIIVLEEGHVVGKGTHAELMKDCDTYREIAFSQLSEAELEGGAA